MDFKEWYEKNKESVTEMMEEERLKMAFIAGKKSALRSVLVKIKSYIN